MRKKLKYDGDTYHLFESILIQETGQFYGVFLYTFQTFKTCTDQEILRLFNGCKEPLLYRRINGDEQS